MNEAGSLARTPLAALHGRLGARMVPFAGWEMPVSYGSIVDEHLAVRRAAGIFDLGHMGRVRFAGPGALRLAQRIQTADVQGLKAGRIRYGLVCASDGGILDDVLTYREEQGCLVVVNASNHERDLEHFRGEAHAFDATISDETAGKGMIAIQGPASAEILARLGLEEDARTLRYYRFSNQAFQGEPLLVSRTGYTGEDGFELILAAGAVEGLWLRALDVGRELGLRPCGLGARDTLRLEAGMPLYGHEIDRDTDPFCAGLDFAVRRGGGFVGAEALDRIRDRGPQRRLIGLFVDGPRVPRQGCGVLAGEHRVGEVRSGTRSPTLERNIATAMVTAAAAPEEALQVDIRGHLVHARRTDLPFYRRKDA